MKQAVQLKIFCNSHDRIYIYGAGLIAREVASVMHQFNYAYVAHIVTNKADNIDTVYGYPVYSVDDIDLTREGVGVILGVNKKNQTEIKEKLKELGVYSYFLYQNDNSFSESILPIPSFAIRCRILKEMIKTNKHIGVLIADLIDADNTNWRYRAYNICQVMEHSQTWSYMYFSTSELNVVIKFLKNVDVITLLRLQWTPEIDLFIKAARQEGVPVLYSIDDLVFTNMHAVRILKNLEMKGTSEFYTNIFGKIARNRMVLEQVDGILATNTYLGSRLEHEFNKPCKIIKNFLNNEQVYLSKKHPPSYSLIQKNFTIGFFSGTFTHQKDFSCCSAALVRLLKEYTNIKLRIVGYMTIPQELRIYQHAGRIEELPRVDFITLQSLIGEVDVNLAPLVIDEFTNSKSELKFFEAGIMSVPTCASPTIAFKECIENGWNGFLCNNENEWYQNLKALYLNYNQRKKMAICAKEYVIKHYTGDMVIKMIEKAYEDWKSY